MNIERQGARSMNNEYQPADRHLHFDSLCEGLEEYDALPSMQSSAPRLQHQDEQPDERLDDQILAALVSPY